MSGIERQTNASLEGPTEPKSDPVGNKAYLDVYRDLTNLSSQVQMMSDSLAACQQMSKHRPLRKLYGTKANSQPEATTPQPFVQVLLSPDQTTVAIQPGDEEHGISASCADKETQELTKSKSDSENESKGCQHESYSRRCGSWYSIMEDFRELLKESSKIYLYDHQKVDTSRMIDVIRRDLKTLMEVAPSVILLATALSDTISHYKDCRRCSEKISPSLPWILNRIQKLIKYVTTRRQESYCWPNDFSYLQLRPTESTASVQGFSPEVPVKLLSELKKVDTVYITEGIPGVQLLLEVQPSEAQKRFFYQTEKAENCSVTAWDSFLNFSVVQLRETETVPVVQVLVPSHKPKILLDEKREAVTVKEFSYSLRLVFAFRLGFLASLLILRPVARLTKTFQLDPAPSQEASAQSSEKNLVGSVQQGECKGEKKTVRNTESLPKGSNDQTSFSRRNLLERVPEIVREFIREAEAEKMHDQKVKNLEVRVKGLKNLMAELHRNQEELNKVLLDLGVNSEPIIKLTDPGILEKENEVVRRVAEYQMPGSKSVSVEVLQMSVEDVKQKCDLKNRMIMIIMKGLRSNIPKEWWEDMLEYVFDGSKPIEDFDPRKVSELVQQTSILRGKGEKASKLQARALQTEEHPSEEGPIVKGNVGADVEEETMKNRSLDDEAKAKTKDMTCSVVDDLEGFPTRIVEFPATDSPNTLSTPIMELEKQISLLNTANDTLRQEVQDLKNLLRNSVNDLQEKRISCVDSDQQAANLQPSTRASGKTINLTIQIVDKDFRHLKQSDILNTIKFGDVSMTEGLRRRSGSPLIKQAGIESMTDIKESEDEGSNPDQNLGYTSKGPTYSIRCKSDRLQSENDLKSLDDSSSTVADYRQQSEKLRSVLRERAIEQKVLVGKPHARGHEPFRKLKPVVWVPSKYIIPEVSSGYQPGPSRKSVGVGYLLQKPSVMELAGKESPGMFASMANERELQTIPENECSPSSSSSKGMSQAIQQLRTRVRSIHQDVTVLKSKNDRIDKLLDRLTEDAVENSESFEEVEHNLNRLRHQLG